MSTNDKKRYEYKIALGKDINGELLRKSFYSSKSKADAKRKAEKYRAQYELELQCSGEPLRRQVLFKDWALQCLSLYKKPYVKENTYNGTYLLPVKKRLLPYFGEQPLDEILPIQVQSYVNKISKDFAPETVKKDFTILSFILQHAVENGLCKFNPASKAIRLPKIERAKKTAYTQQEYDLAYEFASTRTNGLAIMLLMETGISRSELLGLRWEDIDFDNCVLHIRQGLVAYQDLEDGRWALTSEGLKNSYRRRDIPLVDEELLCQLRKKSRTLEVSTPGGAKIITPEFVFHSPEGRPYQPQNWDKRVFRRFMNDLLRAHPELPRPSPHELRHTR